MRPWKEFCDVDIKTEELFEDASLRFTSQFGCRCCVLLYYYYEVQGQLYGLRPHCPLIVFI